MKKKTISISCIIMLMVCMLGVTLNVSANEDLPQVDGSYLTNETESVGYDTKITRGDDLLTGYSKIAIRPNGSLYVGGSTIAAHTVDRIGVGVVVERCQGEDDSWDVYSLDFVWSEFRENADMLSTWREIENPEGGYYYRVTCVHSAGNDMSSSFTDGLYVE